MMNLHFSALNNVRQEDMYDPRAVSNMETAAREWQRSDARAAYDVINRRLDQGTLLEYFIMQSTSDRVELSVRREVNEERYNRPDDDQYAFEVRLDGQLESEIPFRTASYSNGYGNVTVQNFNKDGVDRATTQALKAVIDADKTTRQV